MGNNLNYSFKHWITLKNHSIQTENIHSTVLFILNKKYSTFWDKLTRKNLRKHFHKSAYFEALVTFLAKCLNVLKIFPLFTHFFYFSPIFSFILSFIHFYFIHSRQNMFYQFEDYIHSIKINFIQRNYSFIWRRKNELLPMASPDPGPSWAPDPHTKRLAFWMITRFKQGRNKPTNQWTWAMNNEQVESLEKNPIHSWKCSQGTCREKKA